MKKANTNYKFKLKSLLILVILVMGTSNIVASVNDPFGGNQSANTLPSEQTMSQIQQATRTSTGFATYSLDDGPPTDGGGGGGAVIIPLESSVFPLILAAGVYLMFLRRRKSLSRN